MMDLSDPKVFPGFKNKEVQENFYRWGITEKTFILGKFRFNKGFHQVGAEEFLKDLLNDKTVTNAYEPFRGMNEITGVKFTEMTCGVLNMNYFDIFKQLNMAT